MPHLPPLTQSDSSIHCMGFGAGTFWKHVWSLTEEFLGPSQDLDAATHSFWQKNQVKQYSLHFSIYIPNCKIANQTWFLRTKEEKRSIMSLVPRRYGKVFQRRWKDFEEGVFFFTSKGFVSSWEESLLPLHSISVFHR